MKGLLLGVGFFSVCCASAQQITTALRLQEKITVDGHLNESIWEQAQEATEFTQIKPKPGAPASRNTVVKVLYDDQALYIGAVCYDESENVSKVLSLRDDFNANIDNFQVILDTYNDNQNGFIFGVSSMGVQYDAKVFSDEESPELNMVWHSAVIRNENGWQVEMRIPYSAFRFSNGGEQNWGINFFRYISRFREESTWNPVKPDFDNLVAQCGDLIGVKGIHPPVRLAFMPYVSAYADHYPSNNPGVSDWSQSYNGGMDIKYGVNEAFTLDMTLVPDFGQVVFDNQVLNLSPFEIQFNENRQFFTEGTELFNKSGLFYSRRIGIQAPAGVLNTLVLPGERLDDIPQASQLYNATKLSGRNKNGLGIGIFNAVTAPQKATAIDLIDDSRREVLAAPLTNYNVLVLDQNLKNNSFITLTNTNVWREGAFYDANVTGLNTKFNDKNNRYYLSTRAAVSQKLYTTGSVVGHNAGVTAGKQTGNFVFHSSYFEESHTYDPNDLGFNTNNNKRTASSTLGYRIFKPFWKLNQLSSNVTLSYNRLYNPDVYTATYLNGSLVVTSRQFHSVGLRFESSITPSYDYFEPRKWGHFFLRPTWFNGGFWISSNYQKRLAIDGNLNGVAVGRDDWREWNYRISPRIRVSDKLFVIYDWEQSFSFSGQGYAVPFGVPVMTSEAIVFGNRDRINTTNTINLRYTLTNLMGFTFRLRHYRSFITYNFFYDLQADGTLVRNNMDGYDMQNESAYNTNFNAFTIDLVYRWVFLPGSEINVVWKNSIFSDDKRVNETYLQNLESILSDGQLNSFSIKILYWLDYLSLKRRTH